MYSLTDDFVIGNDVNVTADAKFGRWVFSLPGTDFCFKTFVMERRGLYTYRAPCRQTL